MQLEKRIDENQSIVMILGSFTFSDNIVFRDVITLITSQASRCVHIDVRGLNFIDSSGLGMLLLARDEAKTHNVILTLSEAVGQVQDMFEVAQFNTLFAIK